jgi:hypothetical protein
MSDRWRMREQRAPRSTPLLSFAGSVPDAGQQRYRAWKAIRDKVGMI